METWYKIGTWSTKIEEIKVINSSDKFVTLENGRREAKQTAYSYIARTAAECKQWRIVYHERDISSAEDRLERLKKALEEAKSIQI